MRQALNTMSTSPALSVQGAPAWTMQERVRVLGTGFDPLTMDELLGIIEEHLGQRRLRIAFANPEFVVEARKRLWLHHYLEGCDLVLPDGVGILWAAKRLGERPLPERVTGTDFLPRLCSLAARRRLGVFFFGARPGVGQRAAERLMADHPGLRVLGVAPGYGFDSAEVVRQANSLRADVVMVCLGNPLQEDWIRQHGAQLKAGLVFGNGGALDFAAGEVVRAPPRAIQLGVEWAWRLGQDPSWARIRRYPRLLSFACQVMRAGRHADGPARQP
jgi:N-acetylglucosaminyldiphosphoundecaprenol N-acetyl-beta-D-mannosaminyltransferase